MKTKLKKGQTVKLIVGADKGKTGEIIKLFPTTYSALVKGLNIKKKHKNGVIAIGNFDGVHLGHQKVINEAKQKAKKNMTKHIWQEMLEPEF